MADLDSKYACLKNAAAVGGFQLPAIAPGTSATITPHSRELRQGNGAEETIEGSYLGQDGNKHSFSSQRREYRSEMPSEADKTVYFAQERKTNDLGAQGSNGESIGTAWLDVPGSGSAAPGSEPGSKTDLSLKPGKLPEVHERLTRCLTPTS